MAKLEQLTEQTNQWKEVSTSTDFAAAAEA